jgi:hypothetical protein
MVQQTETCRARAIYSVADHSQHTVLHPQTIAFLLQLALHARCFKCRCVLRPWMQLPVQGFEVGPTALQGLKTGTSGLTRLETGCH